MARQRAHLGGLVERVAQLDGAHVFDKSFLELAPHLLDDDKTLGRNATLAGIHQAALGADIGRDLDIRILENDVGVTPAKFQNGLLEHRTGLARNRAPSRPAPSQGHSAHQRMLDHRINLLVADHQRAKQVFRKARLAEHRFDRERAARHVRGVLEQSRIAGHEARGRKSEHLPEREIPRHHGENDADRIERDKALARLGQHRFAGQELGGVVGIEGTAERAFLHLGDAVANRLSHLLRHQPAEVLGVLAQGLGRLAHQPSTLIEAGAPPGEVGVMDLADDVLHLTGLPFLVGRERLAIGWVDRMERHGSTPDNCLLPLRRAGGLTTPLVA